MNERLCGDAAPEHRNLSSEEAGFPGGDGAEPQSLTAGTTVCIPPPAQSSSQSSTYTSSDIVTTVISILYAS